MAKQPYALFKKVLEMANTYDFITKPPVSGPNMCSCSLCGGEFHVADCPQDIGHHDGWELPPYAQIICPKCGKDGIIENFWFDEGAQ